MARNALAATLTSSAVARLVEIHGTWCAPRTGAYTSRSMVSAWTEVTPTISRSGCRVSSHGETLTEELGVPGQLSGGAVGGEFADPFGQPGGGADGHGGLTDDERARG